jgi:hypothetical protein
MASLQRPARSFVLIEAGDLYSDDRTVWCVQQKIWPLSVVRADVLWPGIQPHESFEIEPLGCLFSGSFRGSPSISHDQLGCRKGWRRLSGFRQSIPKRKKTLAGTFDHEVPKRGFSGLRSLNPLRGLSDFSPLSGAKETAPRKDVAGAATTAPSLS